MTKTLKDLSWKELFKLYMNLAFTGTAEQLLKNCPSINLVKAELDSRPYDDAKLREKIEQQTKLDEWF